MAQALTEIKDLRKEVSAQLENSLDTLKNLIGEKKFQKRLKKAVKLLTTGIVKKDKEEQELPAATPSKAPAKKRVAAKKSVTKKVAEKPKAREEAVKPVAAKKAPVKRASKKSIAK